MTDSLLDFSDFVEKIQSMTESIGLTWPASLNAHSESVLCSKRSFTPTLTHAFPDPGKIANTDCMLIQGVIEFRQVIVAVSVCDINTEEFTIVEIYMSGGI